MSALKKASESTTALTRSRKGSVWGKWEEFCARHRQEPSLEGLRDHETKLCYILIFASMYRTRKGPSGDPVRSDAVGKACSAVGERISHLARFNPTKAFQGQVQRHPVLVAFLDKLSMRTRLPHERTPSTLPSSKAWRTPSTSTTQSWDPGNATSLTSASSRGSGFCAPPNIAKRMRQKPVPKPSDSAT